jgi:hypothetical protein
VNTQALVLFAPLAVHGKHETGTLVQLLEPMGQAQGCKIIIIRIRAEKVCEVCVSLAHGNRLNPELPLVILLDKEWNLARALRITALIQPALYRPVFILGIELLFTLVLLYQLTDKLRETGRPVHIDTLQTQHSLCLARLYPDHSILDVLMLDVAFFGYKATAKRYLDVLAYLEGCKPLDINTQSTGGNITRHGIGTYITALQC